MLPAKVNYDPSLGVIVTPFDRRVQTLVERRFSEFNAEVVVGGVPKKLLAIACSVAAFALLLNTDRFMFT